MLLFELHAKDGHVWKLYDDGTVIGFPNGTLVLNRAISEMGLLRGRIKQLEAALVANKQA